VSLSSVSTHGTAFLPGPSVSRSVGLSVGPKSVLWQKSEQIWMLFGVVSGVSRGMGVLDGGGFEGKGLCDAALLRLL